MRPRSNRVAWTCTSSTMLPLVVALFLSAAIPATSTLAQSQKRKPKVIQLEEIRIEGRVQKPNAFYILNRSKLGYEVMDLRATFVRLIVRSVQNEPF